MAETIVIIGGTSGIGLATAQRAIKDGHKVIIIGRNRERLHKALTSLNDNANATGYTADAADADDLVSVFERIGSADHVVIAASHHGGVMALGDITKPLLDEAVKGKLLVHILAAQTAVKVLKPGGSLTFVSAITARTSMPTTALLAAINGAIASIVPVLAAELAPLRVNAVLPGTVNTDWWDWLPTDARDGVLDTIAKTVPVGRIGSPTDIADAITFLMHNGYTTGVLLPCDGGAHIVVGKG